MLFLSELILATQNISNPMKLNPKKTQLFTQIGVYAVQ